MFIQVRICFVFISVCQLNLIHAYEVAVHSVFVHSVSLNSFFFDLVHVRFKFPTFFYG